MGSDKRHGHQLRKHPVPSPRDISRKFAYRPHTGEIVTKRGVVGYFTARGYQKCQYSMEPRVTLWSHQVAFVLMTGRWPHLINHINGVKADNRWENLEEVSDRDNKQKIRSEKCASKSVSFDGCHYRVSVNRDGRRSIVYFTLWRDAYRFNARLCEGIRRHGASFMLPVPPKSERIKPEYRSKVSK